MPRHALLLPFLTATLIAGCAGAPTPPAAVPAGTADPRPARQPLTIQGALSYRQRIALATEALAVVELRESAAFGGRIVAERHFATAGRQVPLPFILEVRSDRIAADRDYTVRGGIVADSRPLWTSDATPISGAALATSAAMDVGTLWMAPVAASPSTTMWCGGLRIETTFDGTSLHLAADGRQWTLHAIESASGARYVAADTAATTFWSKGERARLTLAGRDFPECRPAAPDQTMLRAIGNEPGWLVELGDTSATLVTDYGQARFTTPVVVAGASATHTRHVDRDGSRRLTIDVYDRPCTDTMSGSVYPYAVVVSLGGRELRGCGGDPATMAQDGASR